MGSNAGARARLTYVADIPAAKANVHSDADSLAVELDHGGWITPGSVERTVQSRAQDALCVKDFGAVGDNATDDTAALQAAADAGVDVFVPAGKYRFTNLNIRRIGTYFYGPPGGQSSRWNEQRGSAELITTKNDTTPAVVIGADATTG